MTDTQPKTSRMEYAERLTEAYIRRKPSRLGPVVGEILDVVEAAAMLRCSIDTVRRIPDAMLPCRSGPGKCVLYLREDVLRYVKSLPEYGGFRGASNTEKAARPKLDNISERRVVFDPCEAITQVARLKRPS